MKTQYFQNKAPSMSYQANAIQLKTHNVASMSMQLGSFTQTFYILHVVDMRCFPVSSVDSTRKIKWWLKSSFNCHYTVYILLRPVWGRLDNVYVWCSHFISCRHKIALHWKIRSSQMFHCKDSNNRIKLFRSSLFKWQNNHNEIAQYIWNGFFWPYTVYTLKL